MKLSTIHPLSLFFLHPSKSGWLILILLLVFNRSNAARDSTNTRRPDYYIDDDQKRIDLMDGVADYRLNLGDLSESAYAGKIYFDLIDSIQRLIDKPVFSDAQKRIFRDHLYLQMRKINYNSCYNVRRFDNTFHFILAELNGIAKGNLLPYLLTNIPQAFNTFGIFKNESCADSFLIVAAEYHPDIVFKLYDAYYNNSYARHVIEEAAKIAPVTVKRYFNKGDPIFGILKTSNDTAVKVILKIMERYDRRTNAYTLLDDIVNGKLSIEKAHAIGESPEKYLKTMMQIRSRPHPLAAHSLESQLEVYSLKFVRVLNDLHLESDAVRFASVKNFSAEELYTLMVYSEEEIFTSTFNGLFDRMMTNMGPMSGYEFLSRLGDNRFRTFIKMSAGFGKLSTFLHSMTPIYQQMLMIKFASGLSNYHDLSQAVEVADAFGSITDTLVLKILRGTVKLEYIKLLSAHDERGVAIYGLLSNLFVDRNIGSSDWFASIAKQYHLPSFDKVLNKRLFDRDSTDRWLIYFYDDEDGGLSFATFKNTFEDPNWRIIDSNAYIIIRSTKGKRVDIYANKPKHEYDGQAALEKLFADNDYEPNVMVHRGHSYYAYKTIEKLQDNTQIFVLGSCGGYHNISGIIERSPDASIISSKQIGTMFVNNPMLKIMADYIREGKDVDWQKMWNALSAKVKDNPKAYERFLDYIPPHKNLGAIFIKTYNRLMQDEG